MRSWRLWCRLTLSAIAILATLAPATAQLSLDEDVRDVRGWEVGYSRGLNGCVAMARFTDGTGVWIGFSQKHGPFIAFTNDKWQSLEANRNYRLEVRAQGYGLWRGTFVGFTHEPGRGLINGGLKTEFLIDFARAGGMTVAYENRTITQVSLAGSRAAIEEALACYKRRGIPDMPSADAAPGPGSRASAGSGGKNPPPEKKGVSSGTGFFVSREGHVLTNFHVVEGCRTFRVNRVGDLAAAAELLAGDERNDLALLKSSLVPAVVPGLKSRVRVGENISVYGFPLSGLLATTGNFTVGNVTAVAGIADDTRMLQISAPVQPGNSGGPLIDQTGNIVGVIVSKLNALSVAKVTNDVPQNVNFAIKASIAQNFLDTNSIKWVSSPEGGKSLDSADVAERARQYTLRITCE